MPVDIYLQQLGSTMLDGKVVAWLKQEGDPVRKGESVVEVETDKVTVEIEAPADGVLGPIAAAEGEIVPVGGLLGQVLAADEAATAHRRGETGRPDALPEKTQRREAASPVARRLARERGLDLSQIQGTGPGGRIVKEDIEAASAAQSAAMAPLSDQDRVAGSLSRMRRVTAERMVQSFTTTPHFYLTAEVDATLLVRMRQGMLLADGDIRLAVTDILVKICARALREFPEVNVTWVDENGGGVLHHGDIHIGLAVATEEGLIVPVLHQADQRTLTEIARQRADIVARARAGKLAPSDLDGGALTISNLGMYRVDQFQAIINPPQSLILAAGQIRERPWVVDGRVVPRQTMMLTLSVDHRVLDGVQAARFLERIAQLIEEPYLLLA